MHSGFSRLSQNGVVLFIAPLMSILLLGGCSSDEDRVADFLKRADQYVENGESEEAIIEFKNVLQIEPENQIAHEALSVAYLNVQKPREAYWEMSETVRLMPENVKARLRYATISLAIGDDALALEQVEAVLQIDPMNSRALIVRGQVREGREDLEGAEEDLVAATNHSPDAPAYLYLLALFFDRHGESEKVEKTLRDLIEIEESYIAVSTLSRGVARGHGRDDEAIVLLERSIELAKAAPVERPKVDPQNESEITSLAANVTREKAVQGSYLLLAAFYFDRGNFEKAIEVLGQGVEVSETKVELIYNMASFYRSKGMTEEENAMILRATEEAPDSVAAQLVLSAYLGRQNDLAGALASTRAAVALEPNNRSAQLREAELLVDIGYRDSNRDSIQAGREIVDSVLEEEPGNPEAHFVRAKLELADGDVDAAQISLETVLQARPDWAQARFVFGSALAASGKLSRARVELARAVEIDPTLHVARKLLVQLHSQLGEHEFAIELGREYLVQFPEDIEIRILVGQSLIRVGRGEDAYAEIEKIPEDQRDAAAYFALGRLDIAYGRLEKAAVRLRKADELSPGNPQVIRGLLQLDQASNQLDQSVARIERALAANPENSEIAEVAAEVKLVSGDLPGARASLERAVELESRNVTAQLALADLENRAGNVEGMIAVMERATAAVPESSDLKFRLAVVYESNGRRAEAIDAYERSISLNGDLAMAKNNLAYLLTQSGGDLDRALELAQQAKEQLPDDANSADTLGWVLLKRGVPSAAIGYLEEAAERFPETSPELQGIVRNHLAEAYEANKNAEKALVESQKSLGYFQEMSKIAKERGIDFPEPDWSIEARARVQRLSSAS